MIQCFLIERTGRARRYLRRYNWTAQAAGHCAKDGQTHCYHNAVTYLDTHDIRGAVSSQVRPFTVAPPEDPRWPTACEHCGYLFQDGDQWQLFIQDEYRRTDTGALGIISEFPAGAMWWAPWYADPDFPCGDEHGRLRKGQPHLILKTPAGDWDVDGPSSNRDGQGWSRSGDAPRIVAKPSIWVNQGGTPNYHGWLGGSDGSQPGVLVEC